MKKITVKISLALTLFLNINLAPVFAAFLDVNEFHQNYQAINFLQEQGILNGYADGTFKPDNAVNRAEFLKIILEGSNIPLDISMITPFNDVDNSAWYAPYIRKAFDEGWIVGYADMSFKPAQTINKVEALKILGEVQNWQIETQISAPYFDVGVQEWFTPYVSYAKSHEFLEEAGSLFEPAQLMTRAKISEIIYRTLIDNEETPEETPDTQENPEEETDPEDPPQEEEIFTPIEYSSIPANYYNFFTFTEIPPNTFYQNEIYIFSGTLNSGNESTVTAILEKDTTGNVELFTGSVENNSFEVAIHFTESGNFSLGFIPGESGQSLSKEISVLPAVLNGNTQEILENPISSLNLKFENSQTILNFGSSPETLKKFTFTQGNHSTTYITRQNIEEIPLIYKDFKSFSENKNITVSSQSAKKESTAPLKLSSNWESGISEDFPITEHTFSYVDPQIEINSLPETFSSIREIEFSGSSSAEMEETAYVIKPDGTVDDFTLNISGDNFTFNYSPASKGTYIIEINNTYGIALLNHPIYIGEKIPLVPDFLDLVKRSLFTGTLNLENERNELLNLINDVRDEYSLSKITISDELNNIAQSHSLDMAQNNYFGHTDSQGRSPDERRIDAGIKTPVGENIAQDVSISSAHYGLMRSAAHRDNILNPDWERIGIGIALKDGYLFISEEFSTNEITTNDLSEMKNELFSEINNMRQQNNLSSLIYNTNIESACAYLNNQQINEGITLNNSNLSDALDLFSVNGTSQAIGRTHTSWSVIIDSIKEDEKDTILNSLWQYIGIDVNLDSTGNIYTMFITNY